MWHRWTGCLGVKVSAGPKGRNRLDGLDVLGHLICWIRGCASQFNGSDGSDRLYMLHESYGSDWSDGFNESDFSSPELALAASIVAASTSEAYFSDSFILV